MDAKELIVGHVYEAKYPRPVGLFNPLYDDRQILFIGSEVIQYDSPTVKENHHYPKSSIDQFLRWVGRDVTGEMPKGEWRRYEI